MKTALVIGGSGMLAGLTRQLTSQADNVGVVGRPAEKLARLEALSSKIVAIPTDYTQPDAFLAALKNFIREHGQPSLTVAWIHSTSPEAPLAVARLVTGDFYDVVGHAGAEQDHISRQREPQIRRLGLRYHRVILGRMGDRWLTDDEISSGVYRAVQAGHDEVIVGEL